MLLTLSCTALQLRTESLNAEETLSFNRDIRPILSDRCFQCHGPDENQRLGGFRIDVRESALEIADSGVAAIVPGDPDSSELVRRIFTEDPDEMMPPADINKKLSPTEKELLKQWIIEGAHYENHWALITPKRPDIPQVELVDWPRNAIDQFILAKLERKGLKPSPQAELTTLYRRLSLDLTGLPPEPSDVDAFIVEINDAQSQEESDQIYLRWVNHLLDSKHYGERMAIDWLDAARFADSNGYQVDRDREMYAWRDWVIDAFNANQPFDQFTIDQLAGDLLPNATLQQKIATGFHRNHLMNEEGGIIPEEFLNEYCADRVETTATVWLGQTFNCCRCHDHKFDPFTQTDFYSLYAFFHNVAEKGVGDYGANIRRNSPPMIQLPAPDLEAKLESLREELKKTKQELSDSNAHRSTDQASWETRLLESNVQWSPSSIIAAKIDDSDITIDSESSTIEIPELAPDTHSIVLNLQILNKKTSAIELEFQAANSTENSKFELHSIKFSHTVDPSSSKQIKVWPVSAGQSLSIADVAKALDENERTKIDLSFSQKSATSLILAFDQLPTQEKPLTLEVELKYEQKINSPTWKLAISTTETVAELLAPQQIHRIASIDPTTRSKEDTKQISDYYQKSFLVLRRIREQIKKLEQQIDKTDLQIPTTLVMEELPEPRPTFILVRGEYNKKGKQVTANTPAILPGMANDLPKDRLGLAKWLISPDNPLTARVTVNRFWQSLFGVGLVRTTEDFGMQGELPSHPDLLDWLATEFVESGWDIKSLMRLLVNSSTYRQSSRLTPDAYQRDPDNRLLARGPRFRLQAEFVRDQALLASGLLVNKIGGPSVRPYHPPGLYEQVVSGSSASTYIQGHGEDLYRRSLYTYWKRSVPNPAMLVFDAPFREMCSVRRSRTNTPLQALNLMNDPTYVEASKFLAQRMLQQGGDNAEAQISHGHRLVLARTPNSQELSILSAAYQQMLDHFNRDPHSAQQLLNVGESPVDQQLDSAELAAMTTIASTILNLDETLTKE